MLKIRLSMGGAKKRPIYKIVIADSRFPRDGRFIEKVGFFNPLLPKAKKERVNLEVERINPKIIDGSRKKRISGGAGADPATINKLLRQFKMMTNMMKKMSKGDSKGGIPPEIFNQLK